MSQKVYEGVATGLRNTINTSVVNLSTTKNVDLHWEESRSGTSNRSQMGEWAVPALKDELVISATFGGRTLTEISTSASENEGGYLMRELKGGAMGIT